jgi:hypothetical protein
MHGYVLWPASNAQMIADHFRRQPKCIQGNLDSEKFLHRIDHHHERC